MINKSNLRSKIFKHLDGLAVAPVIVALEQKGVLGTFKKDNSQSLKTLTQKFNANQGYLNIALRILCSQGFLEQQIDNNDVNYNITPRGKIAFTMTSMYKDVVKFLKISSKYDLKNFEFEPFQVWNTIYKKFTSNYNINFSEDKNTRAIQENILTHIEGYLVAPTIVRLGMSGMFHKYFMETSFRPEEFHRHPEKFIKILKFFTFIGWFTEKNGTFQFTDTGLFFAKRAAAYGVTVSYFPTFSKIDELIFGNASILRNILDSEDEVHVDREMNVWGSGGAHSTYFKVIDSIIIELFNKPINEQPKGILDMGCGNGAFLKHIFDVIDRQTLRGTMLDDHPLCLVGVDYNNAALKVTRANLIKDDIWAKVIWGDIGKPDHLAKDLQENYDIDLKDLLNVRTFLDHNRIWQEPDKITKNRVSNSSGAFAYRGKRITNDKVEDNLLAHLKKWAPFVKKFGLLIIELHTIKPEIAAVNIGKTAVTAYDATHGFSDQYIVEIDVLHKICAEAGLFPDEKFFKKFPDKDYATVSINLLKGK